ncbi:MAG: hypothetical protein WC253_03320 [Sulfurovaceae bacterium]
MVKYTKNSDKEEFFVSGLNANTLQAINSIIENLKWLPFGYILNIINSKKNTRNYLMNDIRCFTNHDLFLFIKKLNNNPTLIAKIEAKIEDFKKLTA